MTTMNDTAPTSKFANSADMRAAIRLAAKKEDEGPVGEGEELFRALKKKYTGVRYDPKTGIGHANFGGAFQIKWEESGNDAAVSIYITNVERLKGDPDLMMKAMEKLAKIIRMA